MTEWFGVLATDTATQLQAGYIGGCVVLVLLVFLVPGWRRKRAAARHDLIAKAPGTSVAHGHGHGLQSRWMRVLEGPGSGAVLHLLVILGTATCALIGWRIPAEVERIYGAGARFGLIFPNVDMPMIGRLAQVIGAATFGAVALRMLRLIVPLISLVLMVVVGFLAINYIFDLPGLGLLGS